MRPLAVVVLLLISVRVAISGQPVTFTPAEYSSQGILATQADMNGDGILDIINMSADPSHKAGFYVTLSNPDGGYQAPAFYTLPYSGGIIDVAIGDFNRDGKVDIAGVGSGNGYFIFLNNGDGTLLPSWNFVSNQGAQNCNITTADFNRDGKLDLVMQDCTRVPLQFLYGHGDGTFSVPFVISTNTDPVNDLFIGDYDGDGNADLGTNWAHCDHGVGCRTFVDVYYSDGQGRFSSPTSLSYDLDYQLNWTDDVNSDGRSDIYGYYVGGSNILRILYGNKNRTFTVRDITPATSAYNPQAVDLDGDGIKDLAVVEFTQGVGTAYNVAVLVGKSDGSYRPEQYVYSNDKYGELMAGRYDRDTKPDLVYRVSTDINFDGNFEFLHNTTQGRFPSCATPNAALGIAVCTPKNGSTVGSPVKFNVGAAFTSRLRKTEVWIDGVKRKESFNSYATYSFLKGSFSLTPGPHRADIYSATYDNLLQHVTVNFTVR